MTISAIIGAVLAIAAACAILVRAASLRPVPRPVTVRVRSRPR